MDRKISQINGPQMDENCRKWPKMAKNGPTKWATMAKNGRKWAENGRKGPKMSQKKKGRKWPKTDE